MRLSISQTALLSRLLDEALPLDAAGRRAWLEKLLPQHQDLAEALRQALLPEDSDAAGSKVAEGLSKVGGAIEAPRAAAGDLQAGVRVGTYELMRPLGAGGMAQVWLARRADGAFKRDVALKLPTLTHLRADLAERFARERDILAGLEHPHIARFYDAGVAANGLPYIALEYVRGQALTDYCDANRLGIAARLELFLQVLDAVSYAHAKRVIHRDLKPSNILVNESAAVQLLDFGVAKLLEPEEVDRTALTSAYGRALTPDYASPELLRGDPIDPRSDVYALGVVLYELLTGARPYRLRSAASVGLVEEAIAHVEPKKPSTQIEPAAVAARATTSQRLARELRGDLDAIALKALAKDPLERYPSAATLADDLQRYLDGKAVQARHARLPDRLRKFARRNKVPFGVGVTGATAILVGLGYTLYRETQPRTPDVASLAGGRQAPSPGSTPAAAPASTARETSVAVLPFVDLSKTHDQAYLADGLSEELINLLTQVPDLSVPARTSSSYFKERSATPAEIGKALHVAYLLEGSVRSTGRKLRITVRLIVADTGLQVWWKTYDRDRDDVFKIQDEIARAVLQYLRVALSVPLGARSTPRSWEAYRSYLEAASLSTSRTRDEADRALAAYRAAIAIDDHFAPAWVGLSYALSNTADTLGANPGKTYAEARSAAQRAIELDPGLAQGYLALANVHIEYDWDWNRAEALLNRAESLEPGNPGTLSERAWLAEIRGDWDKSLDLSLRWVARDPLNPGAHWGIGDIYYCTGRYEDAAAEYRRALTVLPEPPDTVQALLARSLMQQGHLQDALEAANQERNIGFRLWAIAMIQHKRARNAESDAALEELKRRFPTSAASSIADVYATRGELDHAFEWSERAYANRNPGVSHLKCVPDATSAFLADPRYRDLLRKLNLSE